MRQVKIRRILDFPDTRQGTNFTCGAACVQGVLHYYGIEYREGELREMLNVVPTDIENSGVRPAIIVDFLTGAGLHCVPRKHMEIRDLIRWIERDTPVIIPIQAWDETYRRQKLDYSTYDDGHYIVAIGYTDGEIIFDDPSLMSNRGYLPFKELDRRWHDQDSAGARYEHFGIAVIGTPRFDSGHILPIL